MKRNNSIWMEMPFLIPGILIALLIGFMIGLSMGFNQCVDAGVQILHSQGVELNVDTEYFNDLFTQYTGDFQRIFK